MINIEQCRSCEGVKGLLALGYTPEQVSMVGRAANFDSEVYCPQGPEAQPGGWQKCHASAATQVAMRLLARLGVAAEELPTSQELGYTKANGEISYSDRAAS